MHLSINFHSDNIYLLNNSNSSTPIRNNYLYSLRNTPYNKIIIALNNKKHIDTIKIADEGTLPLNINTNWGVKNLDTNIKNILIPSSDAIELIKLNYDLNEMNCICQDNTFVKNLPNILLSLDNGSKFIFTKWIGYNQVWTCINKYKDYIAYAYIYIFHNKSIFLTSIRKNVDNVNINNDLDIISVYNYNNISHDEFNRIPCEKIKFDFSNYTILNNPVNETINSLSIQTQYE